MSEIDLIRQIEALKARVMMLEGRDSWSTKQQGAYTQTYSTASKTVASPSAATLTDNSGGAADATLQSVGVLYAQAEVANNFADLAAMVNKLTADNLMLEKVVTAIVDDLQALGLAS